MIVPLSITPYTPHPPNENCFIIFPQCLKCIMYHPYLSKNTLLNHNFDICNKKKEFYGKCAD
ncbi:hypothetical protein BAZSYMA_ACONTIG81273_1 [Bathymodiolus azoricus thioautotrophic gill symbiont]|uniref:Uncharacterized protein n=1 Tax=Bathymodiolus azoricus thioautotrophic gill symbiont TaxID=235205 RepID=A0A1H6MZ74_9GAMM|nr:hypothetical protein BAZSYMA_ACONTIG81273_1 [Bathymodiolus azoricus thioautotrophic gill symbiont]